ncbi:MAG: hypothetical protein ACYTG5_06145 [Planctomycetota bacterium]
MHKPSLIGVFVLASSLLFSESSYAQEGESNADQAVSAEESGGGTNGGATAIHCEAALDFEAGDRGGMLNAEVSYGAESFLAAVLISATNESFVYGGDQILMGSLASLGAGVDESYSANIDLNGYEGPLWMQVLVLTEDGRLLASDIREMPRPVSATDAADLAASGDESGAEGS